MQVSEDHCWLSLNGSGERAAAVEVTTDTAAKRGLAPSEDAWRGWLYSGGSAGVCSPQVPHGLGLGSYKGSGIKYQGLGIPNPFPPAPDVKCL